MNDEALHRMSPQARFSDRADAYARCRPDYPAAALDAILSEVSGVGERKITVADLGAGTGISSRMLAERGCFVHAIEPNAEMRSRMRPHLLVEIVDAGAESIPLGEGSVDLVTAFQAFHWFDPARSLTEAHRILRTRGLLALVWNERDDERDPFTAAYRTIVREASGNHPAESRMEHVGPLYGSMLFTGIRKLSFPHFQSLDLDGLMGRLQSTSYLPKEGAAWDRLAAAMRELHGEWADPDGVVRLIYETRVYLADPV